MAKYQIKYSGQLRTESIHLKSGNSLLTDAPTDNMGKGETFSPTDLTAVSLATCILTVMGIKAGSMDLPELEMSAEADKLMLSNPRRIGTLKVVIYIKGDSLNPRDRKVLEKTGIDCPVALSLHPEIIQDIKFNYY